jgi:hypothetical protein
MIKRKHLAIVPLLLALSAPAWAEKETEYLAVFMDGKKVGYAVHTRAVEGGQVTTSDDVSITISRLGIPLTVRMTETSVETTAGRPVSFESVQNLGAVSMKVTGRVNVNGLVELTNSGLGTEQKSTIQWPAGAVMAEGLRLLTRKQGLKPGTEYTANIFSAGIMQALSTKIIIGPKKEVDLLGRVVKLTEVSNILNMPGTGEMTTISYLDDNLETLKSVMPIAGMQVEMVSCPKEFALGDNAVVDMIDKMFIKSPTPVGDVGSAPAIAYLLRPAQGANLVIPTTDNQQAQRLPDGRIALVVKPVATPKGGTFPYRGSDPALLEATKPTRFLQSDDKKVVELARKAVGNTKDATEAARRIESFVAGYISNRSLSVGYASAAEVVESRQGDCSEFAVLTAALCRAVGIPAQVAVGVAYVEDFGGIEGFGGHAWTQAYLGGDAQGQGGKWVGLDAAFKGSGRGGYDAGHIALAVGNGEPGDFFNMASALGQFTIERITVQKGR